MTEPTAWLNKERDVITFDNLFPEMTPLYEKREWVGLTDEQIYGMYNEPRSDAEMLEFARAIEQALKENNNG